MPTVKAFRPNGELHRQPECIIASNRGPIEYYADGDGKYKMRHGSGGLITALLGAVQQRHVVWIALAMTKADRRGMQSCQPEFHSLSSAFADVELRLLRVPNQAYDSYYYKISNHLLWFAQHALLDPAISTTLTQRTRDDWEQGYRAVNEAVANAIIQELNIRGSEVPVIVQDYQLYLVPELVRAQCPDVRLGHVIYIPWPDARYLAMLPEYMVQAIYQSMAKNDFIGFQTLHDAHNFLIGATYFLKNASVSWDIACVDKPGVLYWEGRKIQICLCPAMLSPQYLYASLEAQDTEAVLPALQPHVDLSHQRQLILRVDRIEPTKNIIRGFQAYERLLQMHPELHRRVTFLALLVPSRESLAKYRSYEQHVRNLITRINTRYGQADWQPIVAAFGNDRVRALACLQQYDVLLVNPVIDGMNLVVKEGGILNKRSGVILLSRTVGAHDTLGEHVLSLTPLDIDATAEALHQALTMPEQERQQRADRIREILLQEDVIQWFDTQIQDLHAVYSCSPQDLVQAAGI